MNEKIADVLRNVSEEIISYSGTCMLTDGIIDSFELLTIIEDLEEAFGILIDPEDVTEKNFGSKDAIFALVEKLAAGV